jgi:hypothetical protein
MHYSKVPPSPPPGFRHDILVPSTALSPSPRGPPLFLSFAGPVPPLLGGQYQHQRRQGGPRQHGGLRGPEGTAGAPTP